MSYEGETASEAADRLQREKEAAAFLSSLGPQFQKARSPGPVRKVPATSPASQQQQRALGNFNGTKIANGASKPAGNNTAVQSNSAASNGRISSPISVSLQEGEERRQQALRRLKATHCSVNQEKVCCSYSSSTAECCANIKQYSNTLGGR